MAPAIGGLEDLALEVGRPPVVSAKKIVFIVEPPPVSPPSVV